MKSTIQLFSKWSTLLLIGLFCVYCAKKDPDPSSSNTTSNVGVVIKTGAKTLDLGQSIKLEANIVDAQGNAVPASSITWTSSDPNIATINGNILTSVASGQVVVTASYTANGATTTSKMIFGVSAPTTLFTVAPEAIVWTTGAGTIDLTPVYFGTGTPSFTYTSSDASVVTVNSMGQVSFVSAGTATIKVKATGLSGTPEISVPVLVVGMPTAPLPVTRVTVTPNNSQMFKGQTLQLTAKAFNSSNAEVTGETVAWSVENDTNNVRQNALSISQTGLLTAHYEGNATIYATIKGITAQATVEVLPDSVILVTPYYVSKDPGTTQQFTAKLY
ncbi:MAG: Ig-like domain-containing protein, partial [Cytophagales bacterium]|nr:Ig-like domain-containing protein [Cytophagales bacterium]